LGSCPLSSPMIVLIGEPAIMASLVRNWMGGPRPTNARRGLRLLRVLQRDLLARVAHTLALVRLRRTESADLRRDFTNALLVGAGDQHFGLRRHGNRDAVRSGEDNRMRETERQVKVRALDRRAITHADQVELALVTFADTLDHVGQQRTRG